MFPGAMPGADEGDRRASARRRDRPEKRTVSLAMRLSRPWEVPEGVSEVRRQEPTKPWFGAEGVPVWALAPMCA